MNTRSLLRLLLALLTLLPCCGSDLITAIKPSSSKTERTTLQAVKSWAFQTQNIDPIRIREAPLDLVVIDPSRDGSLAMAFTTEDVLLMQGEGETKKLVIAYLSVGEAEVYRDDFDPNASYLERENPRWPGNFKVRYWDERWRLILENQMDKILAAGFDGALFDVVDAYEHFEPGGPSGENHATAAADMAELVLHLSRFAKARDPDFLIMPQNGVKLAKVLPNAQEYLDGVDAVSVEDVFFFGDLAMENPVNLQSEVLDTIESYWIQDKRVFVLEYLTNPNTIEFFYAAAAARGFVPYNGPRFLDSLNTYEDLAR